MIAVVPPSDPAIRWARRLLPQATARRRLLAWLLVPFIVYVTNHKALSSGDAVPASLIPVALILHGTVMLDDFADEEHRRFPDGWWLVDTPHGTASAYPIAAGILATPILAVPILLQSWWRPLTIEQWRDRAVGPYQNVAAAVIAAVTVALFWLVCRALGFNAGLTEILTLIFAFGSEMMSTVSQGLWQHGPGILMILAAVMATLRLPRGTLPTAVLLGFCLGFAVAVRPTNLLLAAPLYLLACRRAPRQAAWVGLAAAVTAAPFVAYNLWLFGSVLGGYAPAAAWPGLPAFAIGLAGVLVSPGRGLLLYFPATLLALALLAVRPAPWRDGLVLALAAGAALQVAVVAAWFMWWGGWCFGPRLLSEIEAPILLVLGSAVSAGTGSRRPAMACLVAIAVVSVTIQTVGSYNRAALAWNFRPTNVDHDTARLWDVGDNPVFRGLRSRW